MIKINKKDSIIDIIIKINSCKSKNIILDFPFWHPIIHSYTSLKIIKSKVWKKNLIIITSDISARKIWKRLWIKYSQIWDIDLLEYNYSFFEYTKYLFKRYLLEVSNIFSNKSSDVTFDYQRKYWVVNWKIWFFLIWLVISILLFIFIFYFAVNKTYIYITPEITIKTRAENFVFKEVKENEEEEVITHSNIIKLNKVSKLIYLTSTFWTSWINEKTLKRSKWKVIFYNKLNEKVELLKNTRLQTEKWVLFTTNTPVSIPKATRSSTWAIIPWVVNINITSKIHNTKWKIVGDNANLESQTHLIIPWLKVNSDKIYAKTNWQIKWANNNFIKQLTKEDIKNAKTILESRLKQKALNELKTEVDNENKKNNIKYKILWIDWILNYSDFKIINDKELSEWKDIDNFELSWTIKIISYTYNTEKVLNQLSTTIKWAILKDIEKLLFVNDKSLRIANVISKEDSPIKIKATAEIEAFFSHNFLTERNNYIEKLKSTISWINKSEALKILLNNPNISNVEIEVRPFFINKISKISENIIIKVVEK